ncbi:MAG: hypothetical protein IT539_07550 [Bradyrhizobiaceae bacterium]|nr:hypothetical protein [Bradyrhizobiaceae bacterium]
MTAQLLAEYLDRLETTARAASAAEEVFRREAVKRFRELEEERAFAFRRLNLMRSIVAAVGGAKDEAEAVANGSAAFLRELDWSGASESQKQVVERFLPVIVASWEATAQEADTPKIEKVDHELSAFEQWFAEARKVQFLSLLGREVVELPLVEVT